MAGVRKAAAEKSAKSPKKVALKGTLTRVYQNAILEAAERVFGRDGYQAAKMADIAREAGVAAGTLYNYFESKAQIFESLVQFRGEEMLTTTRKVLEEPCTTVQHVTALIRASFAFLEQHREMFEIIRQ